jgi:hypothetical protein
MKIQLNDPPRTFCVGTNSSIKIKDLGNVYLDADEQITFLTESGAEYDFVRKNWGFYATPSINARLVAEGFKTALVENKNGRIYIMVIEASMTSDFEEYCTLEGQTVLQWLNLHPYRET